MKLWSIRDPYQKSVKKELGHEFCIINQNNLFSLKLWKLTIVAGSSIFSYSTVHSLGVKEQIRVAWAPHLVSLPADALLSFISHSYPPPHLHSSIFSLTALLLYSSWFSLCHCVHCLCPSLHLSLCIYPFTPHSFILSEFTPPRFFSSPISLALQPLFLLSIIFHLCLPPWSYPSFSSTLVSFPLSQSALQSHNNSHGSHKPWTKPAHLMGWQVNYLLVSANNQSYIDIDCFRLVLVLTTIIH